MLRYAAGVRAAPRGSGSGCHQQAPVAMTRDGRRGRTAIALFSRDLRVHDHPALSAAAAECERVAPVFVLDDGLRDAGFVAPNRARFLLDALADLDRSLVALGGRLVLRRGDVVREAVALARAVGARSIYASADVSAYAERRQARLASACASEGIEVRLYPGVTVAPPGAIVPAGGDHFRVFTPYWRRWREMPLRGAAPTPRRLAVPEPLAGVELPPPSALVDGAPSPDLAPGGESAGRARLAAWVRGGLGPYPDRHDDLAGDATSRLSPYVHFGCLSPAEIVRRCAGRPGGEAFLRQLCWRDFHHQVTAAFPAIAREDYRPRGHRGDDDEARLEAWKEGRTGYPIVDAGMRQLRREGFMHNRARLLTASFLIKDLSVDWRRGAAHFLEWLVDGDIANNSGNWQWVAGTGNDTRPNRIFNPTRQAERFDPKGDYVRRYVPELAALAGARIHEPWRADAAARRPLDYPGPIVDHTEAAASFRGRRG
jgi:deoxyribodipyrimidine photo-lyase